ncbi:protein LKAAEAR1-like [Pristis pectinata]|uniref:protein LKAAEAR1-like n=1 Tax=Pristis pectinata TaxID=685728 RepID=UPI00223DA39B|nr:protein LKAAEAR1-like [Pristis pectinata]
MSQKEAKDSNPPNIENKSISSKKKTAPKQRNAKETSNSQKHLKRTDFILLGSNVPLDCHQELEKKKQQILIGQLRAAESHNKIQDMRFRYQTMRAEEINLLISSQPTARRAVRLEALLPPYEEQINLKDTLNKLQRKRVEEIMSDEAGLTINRNL